MTTIIPTLRTEIEARLGELQAESDTLRNALSALADNGADKPAGKLKAEPKAAPRPIAVKAEKTEHIERKPRKSVQAAVLAELERIAPERASAKGLAAKLDLNRNVVSTTLSKLAKEGTIEAPPKSGEGYATKVEAEAGADVPQAA